jgi:hypothetical protein
MKRSTLALIGSLMGLMYLAHLIFSLIRAENPAVLSFQLGGLTVKVAWMLPSTILIAAAALFNWIQWLAKKRGAALAATLLYAAAAPLLPPLFAVPLALALIALAGFIWPSSKNEKPKKKKASEDPALDMLADAANGEEPDDDNLDDLGDLDGLDESDEPEEAEDTEDAEDEPGLALEDDSGDNLRLDPEEDEKEEPRRPRADGMAVFLGIFMGVVVLALIGMVVYGLMGGKLPFMS